jgi:hypothetical protein
MIHRSDPMLRKFIAAAHERATWKSIAESLGIKIGSVHGWLTISRQHARQNLGKESPYWIEFEPYGFMWFHEHVARGRMFVQLGFEQMTIDQCAGLATEIVTNPQTGYPLQALNPLYLNRPSEWFAKNGLDEAIDRYEWIRDKVTDEILGPKYVTRESKPAAALLIRALQSMFPRSWSEKVDHSHTLNAQVVHRLEPAKFVSRNAAPRADDAVDADFVEVEQREALPPPRPDIEALRRQAAEMLANPNRPSAKPDPTKPVDTGAPRGNGIPDPLERKSSGTPADADATPDPPNLDSHARSYRAVDPYADQPPPPPYARRTSSRDPAANRTSPKGGNLNRIIK